MDDIFDNLLMTLALGGLAVSGLLFASAWLYPHLRRAWDKATALARAAFCGAVVVACLFGGAKHKTGGITYPKTDTDVAYLTDAGSYVTNDAVHVAFTRVPTVPDSATFYLDYCALDGTNAQGVATNWVTAKTATFADLTVPFDFAFAAATNYNWVAYTDWTPGPAVQTNGVWHAYWGLDRKQGRYIIPVRTCVRDGGEVIATPRSKLYAKDPLLLTEEEAYERYAPDTAFVIDLDLAGTQTLSITPSGPAYTSIDWGDGTVDENAYCGYYGTKYSHTYKDTGRYVIRIGGITTPICAFSSYSAVVRVLRFADTGGVALFWNAKNLTAFPDGKLARWPSSATYIGQVYQNCTSLDATELPKWPEGLISFNTTIGYGVYYGCSKITATKIPAWPEGVTIIPSIYKGCTGINATELPDWPKGVKTILACYAGCKGIAATKIPDWPEGVTMLRETYQDCACMTADITDKKWPAGLTEANYVYGGSRKITGTIPAWPSGLVNGYACYYGCSGLTGAWTDDPAELMPTNITSHSSCVTGASDALRAMFYSDWGGMRTKAE